MSHNYAIFSARYAPEVGGVESFTANLAKELAAQRNGVTVVASNISGAQDHETQADGVEVVRLPCKPLMNGRLPLPKRNSSHKALLDSPCLKGVDRVLVNTRFYGHSLVGLRFAKERSLPAVVLDHGSDYLTLGNPVADAAIRAHEHLITRQCKSFSPTFAGISSASTRWLKTFGIETSLVIPNGIDAKAFREQSSGRDYRRELKVSESQPLVVSIGRLIPEKGMRELTEAARLLGSNYVFAIAGEGPLRRELEADLPNNVILLGNLSHPDVSALLSQADLFCLPSRSEGFCLALLEAGAWGLTPLMTHVGVTDEVMGNPVRYGRILSGVDSETIANTIAEMVAAGQLGHLNELREHVESSFSWQTSVKALEKAFDQRPD